MSTSSILSSLNKSGSGLDIVQISRDLATAETAPRKSVLERRADSARLSISAFEQLSLELRDMGETFDFAAALDTMRLDSDREGVVAQITDKTLLPKGGASLEVVSLAQGQVLEFAGYTSPNDILGAGEITIDFGSWAGTTFTPNGTRVGERLTLAAGATLADLARALDGIEGVSARLIDLGGGQISLGVSTATGAANALRFSVGAGADAGVAALDFQADPAPVQRRAASDAQMLYDGIAVTRPSNEITDLIAGMSLTLTAPTTGAARLVPEPDLDAARNIMSTYVDMFNAIRGLMRDFDKGIPEAGEADDVSGALQGNLTLRRLNREFSNFLTMPIAGFGPNALSLADFGVATNRDGTLSLDETRFKARFEADPTQFDAIFRNRLGSATAGITVSGRLGPNAEAGRLDFRQDIALGRGTLNGAAMLGADLPDGQREYIVIEGPYLGLKITAQPDVAQADIDYGQSLADQMGAWIDAALASSGTLGAAIAAETKRADGFGAEIEAIDSRAEDLRLRYLSRFTEMERVITQLNATGDYLTSLLDAWNGSDR